MDSNQKSPQPLVSIVLNSFNTDRFISQQIESILAQTYTNIELIVCDDCSTDRTVEIVKEFMQKDPRVKWLQNERNLGKGNMDRGICLTFQRGFELSQGEFLALSDADDFWLPNKIRLQVEYLQAHPEINLVFTDSIVANKDLSSKLGSFQQRLGNSSSGGLIPIDVILERNLPPGHSLVFQRSILKKLPPVPDGFSNDSWVDLVGALNAPLGYMSEQTVLYRQHEGNASSANTRGLSYYFKRFNDPEFLQYYYKDKSCQMTGHKVLLTREPSDAARKALTEKVANQTVLLEVLYAKNFLQFVSKLFSAFWAILSTGQKYHLKQLGFLALSWGAIRKLKFDSQKI
jgi:glycosyltransferase involved in cell wall biosynthesis